MKYALVLLAFIPTSALADATSMMSLVPSSCVFSARNLPSTCEKVAYIAHDTGRVSVNVVVKDAVIGFSGNRDEQPSPTSYVLYLDYVVLSRNGSTRSYASSGRCDMRVSSDGVDIHRLKCRMQTTSGQMTLDFAGKADVH